VYLHKPVMMAGGAWSWLGRGFGREPGPEVWMVGFNKQLGG